MEHTSLASWYLKICDCFSEALKYRTDLEELVFYSDIRI